jgi:serine/threonine-protein kinase
LSEIRVTANLQHPNLLPLFDSGEANGLLYYVMPFIEGETLRARLDREKQLPVDESVRIAVAVANALAYAHERGVIHRDLKPENILFQAGLPVVADFGIALAVSNAGGQRVTQTGLSLGTPQYMSPEQATGDRAIDARTDIYSLGAVAYEMLAGEPPHIGNSAQAVIAKLLTEEVRPLTVLRRSVPAHVDAAVRRALEKLPADRFENATAFGDALTNPGFTPAARRRRIAVATLFVAIVAAAIGLVPFAAQRFDARRGTPRSIAVLPFENKSADTSYDYLAEGMSDELRSQLTKVPGLAVMARSSSMALKGQSADARDVGAKLKVASVLQGSVNRAGGRLHVTAEVVRTDDGTAVWSETFDQDVDHLSSIRDSVTRAVASALKFNAGVRATRNEDPVARDYYLRGHYLSMKTSDTALKQSLVYFGKALERDPTLAEAQAGIAWTWAFLADTYLSPAEAYPKTKVAALKAIAMDSMLPEGHLALAMAQAFHDWDFNAAEHSIHRAIALRPRYAEAHSTYGVVLCAMGRFREAIAQVDTAVQLDPLALVSGFQRAWVLYTAGRYRDVIGQVRRNNEIDPTQLYFDAYDGLAYRELGLSDSALAAFTRAKPLANGQPLAGLAVLYARLGRKQEAIGVARELEAWYRSHYYAPEYIAVAWANIGDMDRAFMWLEKVFEVRSSLWLDFGAGAEFAPLKKDPRWAALERRARGQ